MLQFTLRIKDNFKTTFDDENIANFSCFPFDRNNSKFRFELSHFEMTPPGGEYSIYRFDFFTTLDNPISWKNEVDQLPEFDIDFKST